MAGLDPGLDPAIPLNNAPPCHIYRDRRVKPGDDEGWVHTCFGMRRNTGHATAYFIAS